MCVTYTLDIHACAAHSAGNARVTCTSGMAMCVTYTLDTHAFATHSAGDAYVTRTSRMTMFVTCTLDTHNTVYFVKISMLPRVRHIYVQYGRMRDVHTAHRIHPRLTHASKYTSHITVYWPHAERIPAVYVAYTCTRPSCTSSIRPACPTHKNQISRVVFCLFFDYKAKAL